MPASAGPSTSPIVPPGFIEARDYALRQRLKACPATFDELTRAMPDEGLSLPELVDATKKALRRLVLKKLVVDVGEKWRLA